MESIRDSLAEELVKMTAQVNFFPYPIRFDNFMIFIFRFNILAVV